MALLSEMTLVEKCQAARLWFSQACVGELLFTPRSQQTFEHLLEVIEVEAAATVGRLNAAEGQLALIDMEAHRHLPMLAMAAAAAPTSNVVPLPRPQTRERA